MRIAVLGPLEVWSDDRRPVTVPGAKERLLLAVLVAASPDVVSTDRIVEALWNGDSPVSARKSLQGHLVHLRNALEPGRPQGSPGRFVVRRGSGYALNTGDDDVDALRIASLVARGRARLASGDAAEAAAGLSAALALWRGEPYCDWPDAPFARAERRRLIEIHTGAVTALLEARLALGEHAEVVADTERLVTEDPLKEEWWRLLVVALYRCGRQADALAAVARARAVLVEQLGVEPGPLLRATEAAVLAHDPALDLVARPRSPPDVSACPYKGLAAYQAADAALFYGRDRVVARLVARLVDTPLLVVSGASGAGKSSVVRAGLVPALGSGALPRSDAWQTVVVTPGRRPGDALAAVTGAASPARSVMLVCDQFEELWAPDVVASERNLFLDTVLELLDDGPVVRCVAVLRGDHVGRLAEHAAFTERLGAALVLVPPLTDDELRDVVRGPAATVGLEADPELLDAVVADVAGRPAALPLLSTALVGTWERRRGDRLTLAGYLQAGGVEGALTRSADAAYEALDGVGRDLACRLFVRLADTDDGGTLVRRRVPLSELDLADSPARREVVEVFVGRRLLAVDGNLIEVAHEALLTAWPRLARWLEDDAVGRAVRRHLVPVVHDWEVRGRPDEELYRGARLAAALDWAAGPDADPTPLEEQFLTISRERADAELRQAHEQVARERRARRRARQLATGLAAVLVVALVATFLAVRFQRAADARAAELERSSLLADATRLAALSGLVPALDTSLLLAAQAVRLADTPQTEDALLGSLLDHSRAVQMVTEGEWSDGSALGGGGTMFLKGVESVFTVPIGSGTEPHGTRPHRILGWPGWIAAAASPTEDLLAVAGVVDGTNRSEHLWLRLLSPDRNSRYLINPGDAAGLPFGLAFTGDGRHVNVFVFLGPAEESSAEPVTWRVTQVDVADGAQRDTGITGSLPGPAREFASDIEAGGRTAVVYEGGTAPGNAVLVDLARGHQVRLQVPARTVDSTGFRAWDSRAAQLWADGAVTLYDADGRPVQHVEHRPGPLLDLVAAPDGTWAATVGGGGAITLWDIDPSTGQWSPRESFVGHAGDIREAHITADGTLLVTRGVDARVIVWDVTATGGFGTPVSGAGDRWYAGPPEIVEPDRLAVVPTRPVSGVADGEVAMDTTGLAATFFEPGTGRVVDQVAVGDIESPDLLHPSMAVSPDGRMVAISTGVSTTVLDTRTRAVMRTIDLPPDGDLGSDGRPLRADTVSCVAWTPDSARLLLCTEQFADNAFGGSLLVVDPTSGQVERRVDLGPIVPEVAAVSRDHQRLALAQLNLAGTGIVMVLDARTLEGLRVKEVTRGAPATDISFSPDGRWIAVTGQGGELSLVDTSTWEFSRQRLPVGSALLQAEWFADSRTVVLGSADGTVSLFDVARRQLRVPPVSVSNDGRAAHVYVVPGISDELVALSGERPGRRWPADPQVWVQQACALAGRDLSRPEWATYLPDRPYAFTCSDLE